MGGKEYWRGRGRTFVTANEDRWSVMPVSYTHLDVYKRQSMFHVRPHASKLALVSLMEWLKARHCQLVDCQMATDHIMRYGAECIPRHDFLQQLRKALCRGG